MIDSCNDLQQRGAKIPTPVKISVISALFLAAQLPGLVQWILIILAIVAVVYYKKYKKAAVKREVEFLQTTRIPEYDTTISKIDQQLEALQPWLRKVQSLMTEDLATMDYVRGIRAQLRQGAPNWFTALRAYQADLAAQEQAAQKERDRQLEEQHRQYMEEQARQTAANSASAAQEAADARELAAKQAKAAQRKVNPYGWNETRWAICTGNTTGVSDIDVLAHEFAHYIMDTHITLSADCSGVIKEGFADIFACLVEYKLSDWDEPDWRVTGDNIDADRCISDPSATGNPDTRSMYHLINVNWLDHQSRSRATLRLCP